jgi:hypothetical protein
MREKMVSRAQSVQGSIVYYSREGETGKKCGGENRTRMKEEGREQRV